MVATVSVRTLKNQISEVLRQVEAGASFDVLSNGRPVAELRPHSGSLHRRRFVPMSEFASFAPADPRLRDDLAELLDNEI